jgi:assimilatory nitrate reductase (NADH) alpha subunit apoprotein (EC 1.7.1.1)
MDGDPHAATVDTTCPYCGVGCGVRVSVDANGVKVGGDPAHPANRGRLCVKGSSLGETLGLEGRLLQPQQRVDGAFQERDWDTALDAVARGFAETIAEHGPDSVALYVSGQLLTEDYYVANKLMKGYLGSANIDTNSRLCMASAVAGYKRAFGEDVVPVSYDDVEQADLVVLVGSNLAWCHPVLYQRLAAARAARPEMKVVVIDPRHTATCAQADLHLPLASGSDVMLFAGLLVYLEEHGVVDAGFLSDHTLGASGALRAARSAAPNVASVAAACDLPVERLGEFYRLFAGTERVVTLFSQGVNQSSSGTDKVNAIINCHLLSGRIGRPGMGPFSITGQPNAMGGREVGGLANQLAAHLDLENAGHRALVQGFWNSPLIAERPGLKAVELFDAVHDGRIKALWIIATNPVVSLPQADRVKEALQRCPLVVVSDVVADTETTRLAHWRLPAAAWGEKEGTVTNSERVISRQRAFRTAPGEARPDWWMLAQVGRRLGHEAAFDYLDARAVFVRACGALRRRRPAGAPCLRHRRTRRARRRRVCGDDAAALAAFGWPALFGGPLLSCRWPRALRRHAAARADARHGRGLSAGAQHRARARPVAQHDPHRSGPDAGAAHCRALRRSARGGCPDCRPARRRDRARQLELGLFPRARDQQRRPAARPSLRAHPLE